jgi:hypothetical protein
VKTETYICDGCGIQLGKDANVLQGVTMMAYGEFAKLYGFKSVGGEWHLCRECWARVNAAIKKQ